jgi:hypothetical protein
MAWNKENRELFKVEDRIRRDILKHPESSILKNNKD